MFRKNLGLLVSFWVAIGNVPPGHAANPPTGEELFKHEWKQRDTLSPNGDGVGPVFNAVSCAACHRQRGLGGSGPNENNAQILSVVVSRKLGPDDLEQVLATAKTIHPDFATVATVPLHRFGTNPDFANWRESVLESALMPTSSKRSGGQTGRRAPAITAAADDWSKWQSLPLVVTERNTPALFGAGLIDLISSAAILENSKRQSKIHPEIKGVFAGKFGWRGQVQSLHGFVSMACSNELGLQNPGRNQPIDPLNPGYKIGGNDMESDQVDRLAWYVGSLDPPVQKLPTDPAEANLVRHGRRLFETVACTGCHTPKLGEVDGLYSDLLTHDMGPDLSDPLPGPGENGSFSTASYYSPQAPSINQLVTVSAKNKQRWRTPPLWGVHSSAPYLHDGRAKTLEEAIARHGGEAEVSLQRYRELPYDGRKNILRFLKSLVAPDKPKDNALVQNER